MYRIEYSLTPSKTCLVIKFVDILKSSENVKETGKRIIQMSSHGLSLPHSFTKQTLYVTLIPESLGKNINIFLGLRDRNG